MVFLTEEEFQILKKKIICELRNMEGEGWKFSNDNHCPMCQNFQLNCSIHKWRRLNWQIDVFIERVFPQEKNFHDDIVEKLKGLNEESEEIRKKLKNDLFVEIHKELELNSNKIF
ncbi:MAG: hypothetical protein ABEK17_02965 [Candidatus Aenigmatarchaeota archaeon]